MTGGARSRLVSSLTVAVLVAATGGSAAAGSPPVPPADNAPSGTEARAGTLLFIGGAMGENREILEEFVRLADLDGDGPRSARIAVITASSYPAQDEDEANDPDEENATTNGRYYVDLFERFGAQAWPVPIDEAVNYPGDPYVPDNADDEGIAQQVQASTAVFLGGGDQIRYFRSMMHCDRERHEAYTDCRDTRVLSAIRDVLRADGVVAGTSAGLTILQSAPMISGGQPYEAWRDGARPGYFDSRRLAYIPYGGFGLFHEAMLDSHFSTWGRQVRMVRLAMDRRVKEKRILGVDETTALVVDRATWKARVIGKNGVSLIDVSRADQEGTTAGGVRWSYLTRGDQLDLKSWEVKRARGSDRIRGSGSPPPEAYDIWDSVDGPNTYTMRDLAVGLVDSDGPDVIGFTLESDPPFITTLVMDGKTKAWTADRGQVSFANLEIRVAVCCLDE